MDKDQVSQVLCELYTLGFELKCMKPKKREEFERYAKKCVQIFALEKLLEDEKISTKKELLNNKVVDFKDYKYLKENKAI